MLVLRAVAAAAADPPGTGAAAGGHPDASADSLPVAASADQLHGQPVATRGAFISQEDGCSGVRGDQDIRIAVAIVVSYGEAPAISGNTQRLARRSCHVP